MLLGYIKKQQHKNPKTVTTHLLINIELQPEVVISEERPQIRSTQAIMS